MQKKIIDPVDWVRIINMFKLNFGVSMLCVVHVKIQ